MTFADLFVAYINENQLFKPTDSLLVAASGGIDSAALVHLLHTTGYRFSMVHCNFGLRGEESEADEVFVKQLANQYRVALFHKYLNAKNYAAQEQISIQVAARNLRYHWFNLLLQHYHYQYLLTAHHQNDMLETVLYNFTKGTGIAGLHGIKPQNGHLIRPLLFATKNEIVYYAKQNQLAWREDSSNQSSKYSRNLIRNEVVPILKQINPNLEQTMQNTIERLAAVERIFDAEIEKLRLKVVSGEGKQNSPIYIDIEQLKIENELVVKLYELLKPYNFNYVQTQQIIDSLYKTAGRSFETATHLLVKDRNQLVITPKIEIDTTILQLLPETRYAVNPYFELHIVCFEKTNSYQINRNLSVACLDKSCLVFPLVMRLWQEGDKFQPLGMRGMKKISDFLTDKKIPLNLKSQVWVLCSGKEIVWVIGHRIDERYKVQETTKEVYQLSLVGK
jgi:tRNA(Ile)-lysidine synthase